MSKVYQFRKKSNKKKNEQKLFALMRRVVYLCFLHTSLRFHDICKAKKKMHLYFA